MNADTLANTDRIWNPLSWVPSAGPDSWPVSMGLDDMWRWAALATPTFAATHAPAQAVAQIARQRCASLITFARNQSRFYSRRWQHLPAEAALEDLPPVSRSELMANFDQWVTDAAVHRDAVEAFIADPRRHGEPFLGRYAVWTSSGTTGVPGIYLSDPDALAVYEALLTMRITGSCGAQSLWNTLLAGGRLAMIAALEGHFAGIVSWERMRRLHPWLRGRSQAFSVTAPTRELVAALNAWQPTLVSSYPSMLSVLADEAAAGRLKIRPLALWSGGEELAAIERQRLSERFDCPVFEEYGASECMNIAFSCAAGTLHLNADWVILEPVDEHGRVLPPGEPSASALLTNLSNRVQPLIRYELGDSVTLLSKRCDCGCPLPGLRVEGRRDDVLKLDSDQGSPVTIVPLAIESVIEDLAGVHHFQVRQTASNALSVHLSPPPRISRQRAWQSVRHCMHAFLERQGAGATRIALASGDPQPHPVSGKLHRIQGLARPSRR